jgi:acyl-CoA thioesterase I
MEGVACIANGKAAIADRSFAVSLPFCPVALEAVCASEIEAMKTTRCLMAWVALFCAWLLAPQVLAQPIGIVALGDSNTAGFGVGRDQAFPAQLERMLRAAGHDIQVWNAGVSGDTFDRMLARLDRYVPDGMKIVILQGGYNDLLRRNNPVWIAGYIQAIVSRLRARQIDVVLCGFFYPDWDKQASG